MSARHYKNPKRPSTAYQLFSKEVFPLLMEKFPGHNIGELSKQSSLAWKQLSDTAKSPYLKAAKKLRKEYEAKIEEIDRKITNQIARKTRKQKKLKRLNGYQLFDKENRPSLKEHFPELSFVEQNKKLGNAWRSLNDEEQEMWKVRALQLYPPEVKDDSVLSDLSSEIDFETLR